MRVIDGILSGAVLAFAMGGALGTTPEVRVVQPADSIASTDVTKILEAQPAEAQPASDAEPGALPKTRGIRKVSGQSAPGASTLALRIQFERDSANIPPAAHSQLDSVAQGIRALSGEPRILIEGHTDNSGSPDHNDRLSTQRAETIRTYLIEHGVRAGWLTARGAGSRQPLTEEQANAAINRRVEFKRINQ
ncbi:MAG: OmpA family protein [Gammaproteobacteria bacterium]